MKAKEAVIGGTIYVATERKVPAVKKRKEKGSWQLTFSHCVMAGVMLTYFAGVVLGWYATVVNGEPVGTTLDYIMQLAKIVGVGYFAKAFGENIAKIVLGGIPSFYPGSDDGGHDA